MSTSEGSSQGKLDKGKSVQKQPEGQSGWSRFNLLSLDGGGIRGFWTLLMLEKLMELIGIEEERLVNDNSMPGNPFKGLHSFWPQSWPGDNISHVGLSVGEKERRNEARGEGEQLAARQLAALHKTRRYLPCHYFDYICGSSTGALIAIMLGRFRMTVCDCLDEYKRFGKGIFGRPRILREDNTIVIRRPKYDAKLLEQAFQEVTYYRCERRDKNSGPVTIATAPGLCKTFATTFRKEQDGHSAKVFLIRSYRLLKWESQSSGLLKLRNPATFASSRTMPTPVNGEGGPAETNRRRDINYGAASPLEIWEVARAATAALFYFDPLRIDLHPIPVNGKPICAIFEDGGFGDSNNPTNLGVEEIRDLHGEDSIDVVVSIGTARSDKREGKGFKSKIITIGDRGTDPEITHRNLLEKSGDKTKGFKYYRLNGTLDNTVLEVPLDEWKPKGKKGRLESGQGTLNKIEIGFNQWYRSENNRNMLEECAKKLVQRRLERIKEPARWERFAIGSHFYCPERNCEVDCAYRNDFEDHLVSHGNIEKSDISRDLVDNYMLRWVYERREGRKGP